MVDTALLALLATLVAGLVGIARSVLPGMDDMQNNMVIIAASITLIAVAMLSGAFSGTALQVVAMFVALASGALGLHTLVPTVPGLRRLSHLRQLRH